MADEPKKEPVKIEELSAYSLYQVQRSLNEYNKWEKEREGERGGMNGEEVAATAFGNYDWDESGKRQSYRKGKSYDIEDEYRYLMAEQDFVGEGNANFAAEEEAEETIPEADRIDTEYSEGIGVVNQALDDATLGEDFLNQPAVDPTNRMIDAEPVSISNPDESSTRMGGIKQFQSDSKATRTIKNKSINI
tara:strand:- start:2205 stop:2777 length:573 start_codon:yes stop_codon:yes gene_type:complete